MLLVQPLDFELSESGVRHVYRENNNPFSNDVEPEYIALNGDETKAYVVLQVCHQIRKPMILTQALRILSLI